MLQYKAMVGIKVLKSKWLCALGRDLPMNKGLDRCV
jgi:hypothetical protein